jgi:hypothetical protein
MGERAPVQLLHLPTQSSAVLTKKLRKAFVRALIDSQTISKPFSKSDLAVFKCLVGVDASSVVKVPNPEYPQDTRHIKVDGESLSWVRAIDETDELVHLKKVMRNIIAPDLCDFLSAVEPSECACCGATEDLTADHADSPFDEIAVGFIDAKGPIALTPKTSGVGHRFTDMQLEAEWIAYHAANAVYQVLCRSCNASKGKRGVTG